LKEYPSEQSEWHWKFAGIKAHIFELQGKFNESLALLSGELPPEFRESDFAVRRKLTQALSLANTRHANDAARLISQAQTLAETRHPELTGEVALRKGTVCFIVDDFACAESAYRAALQSARERHDPYFEAAALSGLGIVFTKFERYDEAIEWLRTALQVAQSAGARYSLAQILGNTAWCYRKLGDYENALTLYKQAEDVSRQAHITGEQIYWLAAISNAYYEQGNLAQAGEYLQRGLSVARGQDDKTILMQYLNALAAIALDTGQLDTAAKYFEEAWTYSGSGVDAIMVQDLAMVDARIKLKKKQFADAEKAFLQIAGDARSDSSQKWGAQAELAALYVEERADAKAENQYRRLLKTVEEVRSSVRAEELRMSFLSAVISLYDDYIDFLVTHKRPLDALQVAELSRARTLAEGLGKVETGSLATAKFRPRDIARRLNSVLLFYWVGKDNSYLWVISPDQLACLRLPKKSDMGAALQKHRESILDGKDVLAAPDTDAVRLYDMLVGPAGRVIPKDARVVVLPGEGLYGLNFETLVVPEPAPHYWIEDVRLSEAGSLSLLSAVNRKTSPPKRLLLVGNPESASKDFPALAQAPAEMKYVSSHFNQPFCRILEGKNATASAYLISSPEQYSYIHFVAHGTASLTRPLESAVILSREGDSYKLYARDILAHPLNAELVTISACNGAGTRAYAGEGLVGLSWAFERAGAHNVIASLWEVSDASSTGLLMDKLYEGLDKGEDPATALRNAKLFILKSNSATVFHKPFYWAPFQLYTGS
jgi:CHAT domain-containing protein